MLQAEGITKKYGNLTVLHPTNLVVQPGELVTIMGPSGAGKSTLLHLISTLDEADGGRILFEGTDLGQLKGKALARFRNQYMGFVFQFHNLLPEFTAVENVSLPALIGGESKAEAQRKAMHLLDRLGLAHRAQHKPSQLSGGEQQRTAVARALVNKPRIVFADEPSGNLDTARAQELHALFQQLKNDLGQTFVIVTHNEALGQIADRCLRMQDGKLLP